MPLQLITGPVAEPISLIEAKNHLRVTVTTDDLLITVLIKAARRNAEVQTQRQLIAAAWQQTLDAFPGATNFGVPFGKPFSLPAQAVLLHKAGVLNVSAINYLDMSSNQQVMPAANYTVDYSCEPCRITPIFGQIWPVTLPQIAAINVQFIAGSAAPCSFASNQVTIKGIWKTQAVNDAVRFTNSGGNLPTGISIDTDYYIQSVVSPGVYTLSATLGGSAMTFASDVAQSFIGEVPADLRDWMLLAIGALYENREAFVIDTRITEAEIPTEFLDGLLDSSRMVLY